MDKNLMPLVQKILKDDNFLAGGIFQDEEQARKEYNLTKEEMVSLQICLYYSLHITEYDDIVNKMFKED